MNKIKTKNVIISDVIKTSELGRYIEDHILEPGFTDYEITDSNGPENTIVYIIRVSNKSLIAEYSAYNNWMLRYRNRAVKYFKSVYNSNYNIPDIFIPFIQQAASFDLLFDVDDLMMGMDSELVLELKENIHTNVRKIFYDADDISSPIATYGSLGAIFDVIFVTKDWEKEFDNVEK